MRVTSLYIRSIGYAVITAMVAQQLLVNPASAATDADGSRYIVLCYHSIPERYQGDPMSISATRFVEHLEWLREQGYSAISLDQVLQAKSGKIKLPRKSFILTVDDGYEDVYTNLFPLLKLHKIPAVVALVGKWIEDGRPSKNETDPYFSKQRFLNWAQIREMTKSGLVEVASHSHDLHHGILGNPQGNLQPAAVTLKYKNALNQYETYEQRRVRIRTDLERNSQLIQQHLGRRPRIMVWPYGAYDNLAIEEAARAGMRINFTLNTELATVSNSEVVPRILVDKDMPLSTFSYNIQHAYQLRSRVPIRAIKIDLGNIFDPNAEKQNQKLGTVIEQVRALGLNTVVLQPFVAAPDTGLIEAAYFPNSLLPMRADLLNRVAWQLKSRLGVTIYSLAPLSQLSVPEKNNSRRFDASVTSHRQQLFKFYTDLTNHSHIHGIIFMEEPTSEVNAQLRENILRQIRFHRSIAQPALNNESPPAQPHSMQGWSFQSAYQSFPIAVINVPSDLRSSNLEEFVQSLPRNSVTMLALDVKGLEDGNLRSLISKVQMLKDYGAINFILNDDRFLANLGQVNSLSTVLSLKTNPYLEVGQ